MGFGEPGKELQQRWEAVRVLSGSPLPVTSQGRSLRKESPAWGQDPGVLAGVTPWVGQSYHLPLLKDRKLRLRGVTFF